MLAPARVAAPPVTLPPFRRDQRMDVAKGLLQLVIFIAHVPGLWAILLLHRNIGFSDASEIFVFTAGHALGAVFYRRAVRDGAPRAMRDLLRRALRLYLRFLMLAVLLTGLGLLVAAVAGSTTDLAWQQLTPVLDTPVEAAVRLVVLSYQPAVLDALALFVVLLPLAALPSVLPLRAMPLLFGVSLLVWGVAQARIVLAMTWPGPEPWVFDPLAWQVLYLGGAICGRVGQAGLTVAPRGRLILVLAAGWLVLAAVLAGSWTVHLLIEPSVEPILWWWRGPLVEKQFLAPATLLHAGALILLVARLVPIDAVLFQSRLAGAVARCGRHSLDVFCCGLVLSALGRAVVLLAGTGLVVQVLVPLAGWGALLLAGRLFEARSR